MTVLNRVKVLGIPVDAINMESAMAYIGTILKGNSKQAYILAINPEKIFFINKEPSLVDIFENASLLIPDGIGVVKAIRLLHKRKIKRVPGADLMQNICEYAGQNELSIFLFGGKEETNKRCAEVIQVRFQGIRVVGRSNGYLSETENVALIDIINECKPDILFIGLGSPKQELWIQQNLKKLDVKICQGVGGTMDTITGEVKRAPLFFQKRGLEWLYRLIHEPRRFKRQLVLPRFAVKVILEKINGMK